MMKNKDGSRTALYRKYRSRSLDELVGQKQVTEILKRSLAQGKVAHAYLLTGPRGVGKTSIARILAHEINKLPYNTESTHLDIIEIDAASNNGVDDVRDLREKVQLAPSSADKKIYIIDEVHMLSKPAFNALLKTLEEPPAHVVFILATTDLHKVPATIVSRTQHYTFHTIGIGDLVAHLKKIAQAEGIKITNSALELIAIRGDGSFRDSISILDQLSIFATDKDEITHDLVEALLGLAPTQAVNNLLQAIDDRNISAVVNQLNTLEQDGVSATVLTDQLIMNVRARLSEQPHYVLLLDGLLSVLSSPQPRLKLLTVLVGSIKPANSQKSIAAQVVKKPTPSIETTLTELKPDEQEAPKEKTKLVVKKSSREVKKLKSAGIDWHDFLEHVRNNYVALSSVLSKCSYDFDNGVLTLYAGKKFNKTKLDEPKYQAQLHNSLAAIGLSGVTMNILPTARPPQDKRLAKVADIMGGGQEIKLDDQSE
jgi:DNA polymerase-3 subunit gamma/tau